MCEEVERVTRALQQAGVTQREIARALGVSGSHISHVLRRPHQSRRVRREIASLLGWHPWPEYAARDGWEQPPAGEGRHGC